MDLANTNDDFNQQKDTKRVFTNNHISSVTGGSAPLVPQYLIQLVDHILLNPTRSWSVYGYVNGVYTQIAYGENDVNLLIHWIWGVNLIQLIPISAIY